MILVSGYYGFDNLGDEAILAALCQDLAALGVSRREIAVPSGNPAKTAALHGVTALGRFDLPGIWRALSSARCLISGGGSLLQDVTSRPVSYTHLDVYKRQPPHLLFFRGGAAGDRR